MPKVGALAAIADGGGATMPGGGVDANAVAPAGVTGGIMPGGMPVLATVAPGAGVGVGGGTETPAPMAVALAGNHGAPVAFS